MNIKNIKVAIVHDALLEDGGSESVALKLFEMFPGADIYTSLVNSSTNAYKVLKKNIKRTYRITESFIINPSFFKPLINIYWQNLSLDEYDLVISSSGSFSSKSIITNPKTLHVCYCHTPPRFLYREYGETSGKNFILNYLLDILYFFMRQSDYFAAQRPDLMVANSQNVRSRIKKYYRKESSVIYPPVKVPPTKPDRKKKSDYYIYIGRLYKQKGVDLLINTFNETGKKLIVLGTGKEADLLKSKAGPNIIFKGYVNEKTKFRLLSLAKALVFPSIEEDFGIVPVEAMSYGVPVIAYYSGGVKESVVDKKTGIFFKDFSVSSLKNAIIEFENLKFDPLDCYLQANKFSEKIFEKNVRKLISTSLGD